MKDQANQDSAVIVVDVVASTTAKSRAALSRLTLSLLIMLWFFAPLRIVFARHHRRRLFGPDSDLTSAQPGTS